jgi:hypothetical protein
MDPVFLLTCVSYVGGYPTSTLGIGWLSFDRCGY